MSKAPKPRKRRFEHVKAGDVLVTAPSERYGVRGTYFVVVLLRQVDAVYCQTCDEDGSHARGPKWGSSVLRLAQQGFQYVSVWRALAHQEQVASVTHDADALYEAIEALREREARR
jgi:hypothetical protein